MQVRTNENRPIITTKFSENLIGVGAIEKEQAEYHPDEHR